MASRDPISEKEMGFFWTMPKDQRKSEDALAKPIEAYLEHLASLPKHARVPRPLGRGDLLN